MAKQKWEYQTIEGANPIYMREAANMMGAEGWELVTVIRGGASHNYESRFYFKRPIQEETDGQGA